MDNLAAFEKTVGDTCTKHAQAHGREVSYRPYLAIGTDYFVKYGRADDLEPELATQRYLFECAESCPDAPRIPKVLHHFRDERAMYLVVEYVQLSPSTLPESELIERMAQALKWLSEVPLPPGHVLGPLGGGRIWHRFFQDYRSPVTFSSVEALERFILRPYKVLPHRTRDRYPPVKICQDRLMFTQSNMDSRNFRVDEHGRTVLLNIQHIGVLPETFVAQTLADKRFAPIVSLLGLSTTSNPAMGKITGIMVMLFAEGLQRHESDGDCLK